MSRYVSGKRLADCRWRWRGSVYMCRGFGVKIEKVRCDRNLFEASLSEISASELTPIYFATKSRTHTP